MTTNSKLTKVLEYLIKNDEEKARELLHQVFIEKARAIHEDLMSMDEMHDDDMEETVGGSGDQGVDLTNEIEAMEDEIDFEETMSEGDDDDEEIEITSMDDVDMPLDDEGAIDGEHDEEHSGEFSNIENKMEKLEDALAELKAEFEKLEAEEAGEEEGEEAGKGEEEAGEEVEGEMDESWELDEDFDDLAESLDLEIVTKDMEKAQKSPKDAGAASSGMSTGDDAKSPVPASQTSRMGAKPVETGKGGHTGYNLETAPKSADLGIADNRRKKASDGSSAMNAGNYGAKKVANSKLETTASEFHTDSNKMSPLSKGGQNLK